MSTETWSEPGLREPKELPMQSRSNNKNTKPEDKGQERPKFDWPALKKALAFYESERLCALPAYWGHKEPYVKWEEFQTRLPAPWKKAQWFQEDKPSNIGILCGDVSGGLVILCFNDPNGAREFFGEERWQKLPQATFVTKSVRGHHVWLRSDTPIKSQKVGRDKNESWLEIRSDGNFTVAPPSLHPSGVLYQAIGVDHIYKPDDLAGFIVKGLVELGLREALQAKEVTGRRKKHPQCLEIISQGVEEQQRGAAALALARHYLIQAYEPEEVFWLLQEWDKKNKPPLNDVFSLESRIRIAESYQGYFCSLLKDKPTVSTFCVGDEKCDWPKKPKEEPRAKEKPRSDEFNKLAVEKLLESCVFIQYCRDNAEPLSEPWWWSEVSVLSVFGEPGRQKIHEVSAPYHRYTERETEQKIKEALKAADKDVGPHTCAFIEQDLGFACPENCQAKSLGVKSPAGLAARLAARVRFNLTDFGNAERLASRQGKNIRYSEERKKWLVWNGKGWEWDFGAKVMSLAKETARNILREAADVADDDQRKELIKHAVRSESEARLTAMVTLAQSEPGIPVESKELNSNPWLFNCVNGTIDLKTGELLPHSRGDLVTIVSPISYDPNARCELWLKFLDRVTGGSTELAKYLQRAVGYSLTGDMRAQVLFFLYGLGNNGKSTFIATIRKIMAGYGATAAVDMFLSKDKAARGPKEDLANLQGKRFVAASEVEVGRRLAVVVIKEMTGGEAIRADRKYEHEVEFQPTHKLWISGNHKPAIVDTSLAIWRRIKLIPFTVTIPDNEIDEDLPLKLGTELSGILAWAVKGCLAWQQFGLKEPREVTAATLTYRQEEDILAEYIQDCCVLKETTTVAKVDLYENYKQWCENTGCQPVSQKTLKTRLMERGITEGHSGSIRYWRGIGFSEGREGKVGQLGQEMSFFPETPIREEIQGKVSGKSLSAVPTVPDKNHGLAPVYPATPCPTCGCSDYWLTDDNRWLCARCHPQPQEIDMEV